MYVQLTPSTQEGKKYTAIFYDENRNKVKTTHFGATGYTDFTLSGDENKKTNYLSRHSNEKWDNYMSAGSLSRWILWNYKSKSKSYNDYIKKFNLKKY